MAAPRKPGGPLKYDPEVHPARALSLCARGASTASMAKALGIAESTAKDWANRFPEFKAAIAEGRLQADGAVESALFKRAVGCRVRAVRSHVVSGGPGAGSSVQLVRVVEHFPPDVGACSLWLRNRQPDLWRERSELGVEDLSSRAEKLAKARERARIAARAVPVEAKKDGENATKQHDDAGIESGDNQH